MLGSPPDGGPSCRDDFSTLLDPFQNDGDVEVSAKSRTDADLDIVVIDEDGEL